jgi:hypothetical protein
MNKSLMESKGIQMLFCLQTTSDLYNFIYSNDSRSTISYTIFSRATIPGLPNELRRQRQTTTAGEPASTTAGKRFLENQQEARRLGED